MTGAIDMLGQVVWQSPQLAPAAVALSAVVAAAVLWLYPPQTRGVARRWRWAMPGLRALAAAALTVAIVQPAVLRPRTAARQGAIVLLVDASRSMSVVDRDRAPAELVALAGGLGALPAGARTEAAPGLRGRLDSARSLLDQVARAASERDYASLSGRGLPGAAARVREASDRLTAAVAAVALPPALEASELGRRVAALKQAPPALDDAGVRQIRANLDATAAALSQAQAQVDELLFREDERVRGACTRLSVLSRAALIETGLSRPEGGGGGRGPLADIAVAAPVYAFTFAGGVELLAFASSSSSSAAAAAGGSRDAQLQLDATGARSNVGGALRAVMQRMGTRAVQAVVLVSDGREVGAAAGEAVVGDVAAAGVPVYAVSAAAPGPRRDIAIIDIEAPPAARVDQRIGVRATLRGAGFAGAAVDVRLDAGDARQVTRVTFDEQGDAVAEFDVAPAQPGPQPLTVTARPLAGEATAENNRAERWIRVGAEAARVTVLKGADAGQQYGTLHEALSRAAWVALREVDEADLASLRPGSILSQDVVILCDVAPDSIDRPQWDAFEQLVFRRGGSVIVCAGAHAPHGYAEDPRAAGLIPFGGRGAPAWRTWPGNEPRFRVTPPTGSGAASPADEWGHAWRQLPSISRFVPAPPLGASARALLVERDSGAAVVTETRRGLGRLYFIGTDQSWRWRGARGGGDGAGAAAAAAAERDHFWPRLVRIAAGEPYAATEGGVQLDADDVAPEPDVPFTVRAKVLDAYGDPADAATQTLRIVRADGATAREVTLTSLTDGSGRYVGGVAGGLPAGDYVLRVDAPEDPSAEIPPDPATLRLRVAPRYEAEMADVSGDAALLRRIADASGGQFLTLEQLNTLPARLEAVRQRQSRLVEYTLWDSPYLFVFVLACLSTEWALRKKFGLA